MSAIKRFVDLVRRQCDAVRVAVLRDSQAIEIARQVLKSRTYPTSTLTQRNPPSDLEPYVREGTIDEADVQRYNIIERMRRGGDQPAALQPLIPSRASRLIAQYRPRPGLPEYINLCRMAVEESTKNGTAEQVVELLQDLVHTHDKLFNAAISAVINGESNLNWEVALEHNDCVQALGIYLPPECETDNTEHLQFASGPSYLGLEMDVSRHVVFRPGCHQEPIDNLPRLTWAVLLMLVKSGGKLCDYNSLQDAWIIDDESSCIPVRSRVDDEVSKARRVVQKFGLDIENVRSSGWRLIDPTSPESTLKRERKVERRLRNRRRRKKRK